MTTPAVFVGVPDLRPDYVEAARKMNARILVSVNAMSKSWTADMHDNDEPHPGFRPPPKGRLDGVRCGLDSAGYTALHRYGDYPWTVSQYVDAAEYHDWEFWASMDLCCEPEIAHDRQEVLARIMRTARLYDECREEAARRRIKPPMPVLQGYHWWDYVICCDAMEIPADTPLIGIGSVCRRHMHGPDGLMSIIDQLDRHLPAGPRFHLFGVKSDAVSSLAAHPRIASMDSQAWCRQLRYDHPTGRTNALGVEYMTRFYHAQQAHIANPVARHITGSLDMQPQPAFVGKSDDYRTRAAECLHSIRNGHSDTLSYNLMRSLHDTPGRKTTIHKTRKTALKVARQQASQHCADLFTAF